MANEVDPWDWSIDRVVDEFCHNRTLWDQGRPNYVLPSPSAFEKILRENDVDGATLLTEVDRASLTDHFGIKSMGKRSSILWAVDKLRNKSKRFAEERPSPSFQSVVSAPSPYYSPGFHGPYTPHTSYLTEQPTIYDTPPHPTSRPRYDDQASRTEGRVSPIFTRPSSSGHPADPEPDPEPVPIGSAHTSPQRKDSFVEPKVGQRRAGEALVEDQAGRKKRRLNLAPANTLATPSAVHNISGETLDLSSPSTGTLFTTTETFTSKKVDSAATKLKEVEPRSQLCGLTNGEPSFLGKTKFSADEIFFGSTGYGKALNAEIGLSPLSEAGSLPGAVFSYDGSTAPTVSGRQSFVNRKILSFLRQPPNLAVDLSDDSLAFYAYPVSSSHTSGSHPLIYIREKDDMTTATREQLSRLESGEVGPEGDSSPLNNHWDYLARWQHEDTAELPLYGESDDEVDTAELDALENEMREDAEKDVKATKQLSAEQVAEIIDGAITEQIREWEAKILPVLQEKALSIWRKGKTAKGRILFAAAAREKIANSEIRLATLKKRIINDVWHSKRKVVDQCQSLDETVEQIEKTKFEMSLWKRPSAPPPPTGKISTRKKRTIYANDDLDEYDLGSEDEIVDDREDLGDFIHVDSLVPLDLTSMEDPQDSHDEQDADTNPLGNMDVDSDQGQEAHIQDSVADSLLESLPMESNNNLPDMSTNKTIKEEPLAHSSTPGSTKKKKTFLEVVDLTLDSEAEDVASSPPKEIHLLTQTLTQIVRRRSAYPEDDPDTEVAEWDWFELEQEDDRIRIVIKLLRTMPFKEYQRLRDYVTEEYDSGVRPKFYELAEHVKEVILIALRPNRQVSIAVTAYERADELLHLYVCWLEVSPRYFRKGYEERQEKFELVSLDKQLLESANETIAHDDALDLGHCLKYIFGALEKHARPLGGYDSEDDVVEVEQADIGEPSQATPFKRRKRKVAESQDAASMRRNVQKNAQTWNDRTKLFLSQNQQQSSDLGPASEAIVVNTGKEDEEPEIFVDDHIARSLKTHQIEGIRFMWREIVGTSSDNSDDTQGCLLAHTMGLGKTCQVIAFLITLMQAAKSDEKAVKLQIPKKLRKMRILILCPAGLINNWEDELRKWDKRRTMGTIHTISAQVAPKERVPVLNEWYAERNGGILLMGYDLFTQWAIKSNKRNPFSDEEHQEIHKKLLQGPTLIVADEAHKLKNQDTAVGRAAKMLRSKSRIALTGSPLSNNLSEYFATVDWIAPGYLGKPVEFRANYVEPIEEGLYVGSSAAERRRSRIKLGALTKLLEPKIHRKEIEALKNDLKPKTEFVLSIPLTPLQLDAYKAFVTIAAGGMNGNVSNARLWGMMACLQLLCSHPTLFAERVKEAREKSKDKAKINCAKSPMKRIQEPQDEGARSPDGVDGDQPDMEADQSDDTKDMAENDDGDPRNSVALKIADKVLTELEQSFQLVAASALDEKFSHKINLLLQIVQNSKMAKDKLLIFSHRIPTLDYLGKILERVGIQFERLDGKTAMAKRQGMTNAFNKNDQCDVFLISTRAGGTGFNLHGANRVILFDFSFNPTWEEQAIGRAFRLGQQKPVYVYRFISAGTFEEDLFNQIVFKTQLAYQAVDKKNTKNKAHRLRTFIKPPKETTLDDLSECNGKDAVLQTVIDAMESGNEVIHGLSMAEKLKELNQEQLDTEAQKEMQQIIEEERLRNTDPEEYQRMQALKYSVPAATARPDPVNFILNQPATVLSPPPATAPVARMVAPNRFTSLPIKLPPKAMFEIIGGPNVQPHGLPDPPQTAQFSLPDLNRRSPRPYDFTFGQADGNLSPTRQRDEQQDGS